MSKMHTEENNNQKESSKGLTMPKAVVVAGLLIAGAILFPHLSGGKQAALDAAAERGIAGAGDSIQLINDVNKDDFIIGAKNPKVTIVEFSDFGCSFCAQFHPTLAAIVDEYPDDVSWVFYHIEIFKRLERLSVWVKSWGMKHFGNIAIFCSQVSQTSQIHLWKLKRLDSVLIHLKSFGAVRQTKML
jgi:thiol-disulfide isomerase/thioredoxin